jgi:ketosteroid isomerase-like protein
MASTLMAVETKAWDAWKNRDAKAVEDVMAKEFIAVSGSGRNDRAAAIKAWSEPKCDGLAYTLSDPKAVSLSGDVALVTYKADEKGTCDAKPVPPSLWVASINIKEDGSWKNAYFTERAR